MKKFISLFLVISLLAMLAACSGSEASTAETEATEAPTVTEEPATESTEAPEATETAVEVQDFQPGTWVTDWDGETRCYYYFKGEGEGSELDAKMGIGLAFSYDKEGEQYTFHMGAVDDSTGAQVQFADETNAAITWADGREENLTFLSDKILEPVNGQLLPAGDWQVVEDGSVVATYTFTEDGTACNVTNADTNTGVPFDYEATEDGYVFHMGSADDQTMASAAVAEDSSEMTLLWWSDGQLELLEPAA